MAYHPEALPDPPPFAAHSLTPTERVVLALSRGNSLTAVLGLRLDSPVYVIDQCGEESWGWVFRGTAGDVVLEYRELCFMEDDLRKRRAAMLRAGRTPPSCGPYFYDQDGAPIEAQAIFASFVTGLQTDDR